MLCNVSDRIRTHVDKPTKIRNTTHSFGHITDDSMKNEFFRVNSKITM